MKFNVGDRVVILFGYAAGEETTVTSTLRPKRGSAGGSPSGALVHEVAIRPPTPFKHIVKLPQDLRHIYDGHELCSWEDCMWQPDRCTV